MSRSELILRAGAVNLDITLGKYKNDSTLEQAVIYAEKHVTASTTATQIAPPADAIKNVSGGANL